ncbi:FAD/NAD(P)-binding domain-containing protein [Dissoconium aciculare CBS 342.82]|uniref:FAD/NAD(P)-binding domain-containing protein n=1 Tax=Dissoconium aciculare CBS 342.82 TaxID=1314786 RepID=A0A6J3M0G9_9PEZI|nr:FAD/NAD(P)-binding domain-containing protein [Dissoconium aciculare CBS 342.82]KAF1820392.1 FAD/NAD(P)-binding domain-containing protein [Dissoconium aciculare CBS 342.82]
MLFDALILGAGPAGLSAALALGRVTRSALVLDSGVFRNAGVTAMHTVLSRDGTNPTEFRQISIEQIRKYPSIQFQHANVTSVAQVEVEAGYMGFQAVDSNNKTYFGRKLVLATGTEDVLPTNFEGYRENWPEHIYQCLFCDGFEQRDYPIGVLTFANPGYNNLALMALRFHPDVTIYTNGPPPTDNATAQALRIAQASKAKVDTRTVKRLINNGPGPENGITIEFQDGSNAKLGMLLHRPSTINRGQRFIDQLGLNMRDGSGEIVTDPVLAETSVKGCFAAGDTQELVKQVAVAMGSGVRVGAVVSMQLRNEEGARNLAASEKL